MLFWVPADAQTSSLMVVEALTEREALLAGRVSRAVF